MTQRNFAVLKILITIAVALSSCKACDREEVPAPTAEPSLEVAPRSTGAKTPCLCECRSTELSEALCKHFTKELVDGEETFVCDSNYLIVITEGTCQNAPSMPSVNTACTGYDPESKGGQYSGKISRCEDKLKL